MTCEHCGRFTYKVVAHGAALWCPACHAEPRASAHAIVTDDIPGGQVIENLGHEPLTFYSKREILAEANRRGLRLMDRWAGPGDKYLTNWAAGMDPYTLAAATALVSRRAEGASEPPDPVCETAKFEVKAL